MLDCGVSHDDPRRLTGPHRTQNLPPPRTAAKTGKAFGPALLPGSVELSVIQNDRGVRRG